MGDRIRTAARQVRRATVAVCCGLVIVAVAWGWAVSARPYGDGAWFAYTPVGGSASSQQVITNGPNAPIGTMLHSSDGLFAWHEPWIFVGGTVLFLIFASALVVPLWASTKLLDGMADLLDEGPGSSTRHRGPAGQPDANPDEVGGVSEPP